MSPSDNTGFDFEAHRREAVDKYAKVRPLYTDFAFAIKNILAETLQRKDLKVHSVEARAKALDSFGDKAMRRSETEPDKPKYPNPLTDITDLAAVRVITFFPRTVNEVESCVREQLLIVEQIDHTARLQQEEKLGYQSVHYLVKLTKERTRLPEYQRFAELIGEIQVRTVLQHAWAEIEHDIQYKSTVTIPVAIARRFIALAGMLEIADREFQAIQDADAELRVRARESVELGNLREVEITPDALRAYLDKKLGSDARMADWSYGWTAALLRRLGFANLQQVDECIGSYSDDEVSRILYSTRQGQLTRFEDLLLASMGDAYSHNHTWADQVWFLDRCREKVDKLKALGISIGTYCPKTETAVAADAQG